MDKNSIIYKESFEVCTQAEDHPKVFVCDKLIAPAVALLNKKGLFVLDIIKLNSMNI